MKISQIAPIYRHCDKRDGSMSFIKSHRREKLNGWLIIIIVLTETSQFLKYNYPWVHEKMQPVKAFDIQA